MFSDLKWFWLLLCPLLWIFLWCFTTGNVMDISVLFRRGCLWTFMFVYGHLCLPVTTLIIESTDYYFLSFVMYRPHTEYSIKGIILLKFSIPSVLTDMPRWHQTSWTFTNLYSPTSPQQPFSSKYMYIYIFPLFSPLQSHLRPSRIFYSRLCRCWSRSAL